MQVSVRARGFELTKALRGHAEERVATALERLAVLERPSVRVTVTLADANGPRGGKDKVCRVRVVGAGARAEPIEVAASDLYAAIDLAAHKLGRWATHVVKRARPAFPDRTQRATVRGTARSPRGAGTRRR